MQWISIGEEMPKAHVFCLVTDGEVVSFASKNCPNCKSDIWDVITCSNDCIKNYGDLDVREDKITHWMPLPWPPNRK